MNGCKYCQNKEFEIDNKSGEVVCTVCGLVNEKEMYCGFERGTFEGVLPHFHASSKQKILGSVFDKGERNWIDKSEKSTTLAKISWNHLDKLNRQSMFQKKSLKDDVIEIIETVVVATLPIKELGIKILNETHALDVHNERIGNNEIASIIEKENIKLLLPLNSRHAKQTKKHSPCLDYSRKMIAISVCVVASNLLNHYFNLKVNLQNLEVRKKYVMKEIKLIKSYLTSIWKIESFIGRELTSIKKGERKVPKLQDGEKSAILDDLRASMEEYDVAFSKKIVLLSMKLFEILDDENILNNAKLRTIVASVLAIYFKNKNLKVSRKLIGSWINIKENRVHNMINNHNYEVCLLVEKLNSITD